MYIAKNKDLIVMARNTREELEIAIKWMVYDTIEETEEVYELYNGSYLTVDGIKQKERERLDMLSLTAADVERAIYKDRGMDFEDVIEMVRGIEVQRTSNVSTESNTSNPPALQPSIDIKALKIELKANNFYRGNPYINQIGALLGYTSDDLDYLFENGELKSE